MDRLFHWGDQLRDGIYRRVALFLFVSGWFLSPKKALSMIQVDIDF